MTPYLSCTTAYLFYLELWHPRSWSSKSLQAWLRCFLWKFSILTFILRYLASDVKKADQIRLFMTPTPVVCLFCTLSIWWVQFVIQLTLSYVWRTDLRAHWSPQALDGGKLEKDGGKAIFTPPGLRVFQPIEVYRSGLKGDIGRKYFKDRNFK